MPLHALHEVDEPFGRPGHGPTGVYNIEHGEAALGQRVEVLAVPAQGRGPGGVAAHVKDDGVPVKGKGGRDLRGQGERLDAGVDEVRGDKAYLLGLDESAAVCQTEIGVDHIQVEQLDLLALVCSLKGKVERELGLARAVIADENYDLFHNLPPLLPASRGLAGFKGACGRLSR